MTAIYLLTEEPRLGWGVFLLIVTGAAVCTALLGACVFYSGIRWSFRKEPR